MQTERLNVQCLELDPSAGAVPRRTLGCRPPVAAGRAPGTVGATESWAAPAKPSLRRILVPTNFTFCAWRALETAVALAREPVAELTVLHVLDLSRHTPAIGPANPAALEMQLRAEGEVRIEREVQAFRPECRRLLTRIEEGLPWETICEVASACDLIVIGEGRPKPPWRLFSRRTFEGVMHHAPCPVLVVQEQHRSLPAAGELRRAASERLAGSGSASLGLRGDALQFEQGRKDSNHE